MTRKDGRSALQTRQGRGSVPPHTHDGADISGALGDVRVFGSDIVDLAVSKLTDGALSASVELTGQLYSDNWDGGVTAPDTGATTGWMLDGVNDEAQFAGGLLVGGQGAAGGTLLEVKGGASTPGAFFQGDGTLIGLGSVGGAASYTPESEWEAISLNHAQMIHRNATSPGL
ncbi:MAG: hypothetical protein R3320_12040, partial [Nitriliruptorales bacterium]|nr:hypothetical protein [Nitriliruptorales bacterium]